MVKIQKTDASLDANNMKNRSIKIVANNNNISVRPANVSFGSLGSSMGDTVVKTMDKIDAGGFIASFLIADGLGFVLPRVGKALFRSRPEMKDKDGNTVYDENGNPRHTLNWTFARKEFLREVITGPSAYLIPLAMITYIKNHFGSANNVKVEAIQAISDITKNDVITPGDTHIDKYKFDKAIYRNIVNDDFYAEKFATIQGDYRHHREELSKANSKEAKNELKNKIGEDVKKIRDMYIKHQKETNPNANVLGTSVKVGDKSFSLGSIDKIPSVIEDYYNDINKVIDKNKGKNLSEVLANFKGHKSGSRIMTILAIFAAVTAFYTQIPKLYNMGLKGNPATATTENVANKEQTPNAEKTADIKDVAASSITPEAKKDEKVSFGAAAKGGFLERLGHKYPESKLVKKVTDFFELDGAIISGKPMAALLFGACLPPRLIEALDFNDMMENLTRDVLAFSALLFGSKALSRVFSDILVKNTGLALNEKDMKNDGFFKRFIAYMNPSDSKYHILSNKELIAKYSSIHDYKGGIIGFADFVSSHGGDMKKALSHDDKIKNKVFELMKSVNSNEELNFAKTYEDLPKELFTNDNLKKLADNPKLKSGIKELEEMFKADNNILRKAKICNSSFGFLSTFILVPSFIIWLTGFCERMTEKRIAKEKAQQNMKANNVDTVEFKNTQKPKI